MITLSSADDNVIINRMINLLKFQLSYSYLLKFRFYRNLQKLKELKGNLLQLPTTTKGENLSGLTKKLFLN